MGNKFEREISNLMGQMSEHMDVQKGFNRDFLSKVEKFDKKLDSTASEIFEKLDAKPCTEIQVKMANATGRIKSLENAAQEKKTWWRTIIPQCIAAAVAWLVAWWTIKFGGK